MPRTLPTPDIQASQPQRSTGYLPLAQYAALGDGRSVALVGTDGAIDWWCVPDMDSPPLFDRLLDAEEGGFFSIVPDTPFTVERRYRTDSNVLETIFITASGRVRLTESLNSGVSGRLPWSELARRIEGLEGTVTLKIILQPGRQADMVSPWWQDNANGQLLHVGQLVALFCHGTGITVSERNDLCLTAGGMIKAGQRTLVALLATQGKPLAVPTLAGIDERIDHSDDEWRAWTEQLKGQLACAEPYGQHVRRSALALKLLLHSPTGAIAAAATLGLPERIGGDKNYDYRYAWVRDAAYTIKALLRAGALSEPQAAFAWLMATIRRHGPQVHVFYQLDGALGPEPVEIDVPGYKDSRPVLWGNAAKSQRQLSMYGDILETAALFVEQGHVLDPATARLLADLANQCADEWRLKDAGLWELEEQQHYTMSKIGCWMALHRAADLAGKGHIPDGPNKLRWERERDRIAVWIDEHCWNEKRQAYMMFAGSDKLDAALLLATRFGFTGAERLKATREAIVRELAHGPLVYRYSGAEKEEGTFLCCAFWLVEAYAFLGDVNKAQETLDRLLTLVNGNLGLLNEQMDAKSYQMLGNMPQGLSHLALIHAVSSLQENQDVHH